jgi:hypothetical protein
MVALLAHETIMIRCADLRQDRLTRFQRARIGAITLWDIWGGRSSTFPQKRGVFLLLRGARVLRVSFRALLVLFCHEQREVGVAWGRARGSLSIATAMVQPGQRITIRG